jgi:hypothetical protein
MPVIDPTERWEGSKFLLSFSGPRYSIGWQFRKAGKGGPCFVVARIGAFAERIVGRFPLTEKGWAQAWRALAKLDRASADKAAATLAGRAAAVRAQTEVAELDTMTLRRVRAARFLGGDAQEAGLTVGQPYDLRFLEDRILVVAAGSASVAADISYGHIAGMEIGGPGLVRRWSPGQAVGLTMLFGELGEVAAFSQTSIRTIVRVQTEASELFFLYTEALPDALRIELAVPLRAIRAARSAPADSAEPGGSGHDSLVDQLSKLGSMLNAGLLTRDEFESLKAKIIAGS